MSKLTFRADDDLVERVEALDASKSEIMREALREYLDGPSAEPDAPGGTIDAVVAERVDALVEEHLDAREREINLNISLDGPDRAAGAAAATPGHGGEPADARAASDAVEDACAQCGEPIDDDHVYCPNCGEKRSRRVFCECGDELRSDWSFCPSCGRRTPAADVLEGS